MTSAGDRPDTDAARWWRAYQLADGDRLDELRREAESGNEHAVLQLASRLEEYRRTADAIAVIRPLAESGHDVAQTWLLRWLAADDRIPELRERAQAGQYLAVRELARWLGSHERVDELRELVLAADEQTRQDLMSWLATGQMHLVKLAGDLGDAEARERHERWLARTAQRARERAARGADEDG